MTFKSSICWPRLPCLLGPGRKNSFPQGNLIWGTDLLKDTKTRNVHARFDSLSMTVFSVRQEAIFKIVACHVPSSEEVRDLGMPEAPTVKPASSRKQHGDCSQ